MGKYIRSLQAYNYYRDIAGEVEARNASNRMGMSIEERSASLASETEDVAREDQIFIYDALESAMGSRVDARMAEIANHFDGVNLSETQRAIVDVFGGIRNNLPISVNRANGETRRVVMRQGREDRGGSKHSIYRHYGTSSGYYTADEVLLIEDVLANGERTEVRRRGVIVNEYKHTIDGVTYKVLTEKKDNREEFADFYTNRSNDTRSLNTQLSARAGHATASEDKDTDNISDVQEENETSLTEEGGISFRRVEDEKLIDELEASPKRKGYRAEKSNLPVGVHNWSNGDLMLSRYDKPVCIIP